MAQTPKDWQFYDRKLAEHLGRAAELLREERAR
jgi:hypothetical protein